MHKYYVTYKYGQKLAQNMKETNGSTTSNPWFNYSHARSGVVMSFSTTSSLTSTQFACTVLIDHQWSEWLYTRQVITWGGSWYKIASACVPACACEEWVRAWHACTSSLRACTASMALGGRVHSSRTSSTSLWSIHTRRSRQRLHMCHVASWTVRETLCSVPLVF